MIDDNHSRLRKISQELYATDITKRDKRSVLHEEKTVFDDQWHDQKNDTSFTPMKPKAPNTSIFKKIFMGSVGLLVIALGILGFSFLNGGNTISEKNVAIVLTTKSFVDGGELFPVEVTLVNKNKLPIELATLVLEYPEGNPQEGTIGSGAMARISRDISSIKAGATHQESFTIQLYGAENSERSITARIEFRVQGSNAVYEKQESVALVIRTSPVNLSLVTPEQAIPNQEIPLAFSIVGNGTATLPNTAMVLEFPSGFTFTRAEPAPSFGTTVWYLGDLPPGTNRKITVYGTLTGSVTDLKTIKASIGLQSQKNEQQLDTIYNSLAQVIPLANAFLDAKFDVFGQTNPTIPITSNQQVRVRITYKNTLTVPISNAELAVRFSGAAYDPGLVEPVSAFFDTAANKLVWTKQQDIGLGVIAPGEEGTVNFSVRPRQLTGSNAPSNPTLNIALDVIGYQSGGAKLTASAIDTKTFTINSDLNVLTRTVHYTGAIQNSGPMPPVAGKETTYALEFRTSNTRNKVTDAKLVTTLPIYVSWKNVIVPQSEAANVTYNQVTREMIWNIGEIPGGGGATTPKTLSVKVGVTPTTNQIGGTPQLTGSITLTGKDTFTNQELTVTKLPLTTQVLNDGNGPGTSGQVIQP